MRSPEHSGHVCSALRVPALVVPGGRECASVHACVAPTVVKGCVIVPWDASVWGHARHAQAPAPLPGHIPGAPAEPADQPAGRRGRAGRGLPARAPLSAEAGAPGRGDASGSAPVLREGPWPLRPSAPDGFLAAVPAGPQPPSAVVSVCPRCPAETWSHSLRGPMAGGLGPVPRAGWGGPSPSLMGPGPCLSAGRHAVTTGSR